MTSVTRTNSLTPDVSVIIPTYNRIMMLEEALNSIYNQDFIGNVQIIVIDDNSQDGTSEVIKQKYPEVHLISLKENRGAYVARNLGIKEAKGRYIAFLDSDDLWKPSYLTTQLKALENKNRFFAVSGLIILYTDNNQQIFSSQKPDLNYYQSPPHEILAKGSYIATPSSVIFPRQVFDEVGLFREIKISADAELYLCCLLAGYESIHTEIPVAIKREHNQGQLTNKDNERLRFKIRLLRVQEYYPLIKNKFDIFPVKDLYKNIYWLYIKEAYFEEDYLTGLKSSIDFFSLVPVQYSLPIIGGYIRAILKLGQRFRNLNNLFLKNSRSSSDSN